VATYQRWLATGERELDGAQGEGFLQGLFLSDISAPCYTTATERRVLMLEGVSQDRRGRTRATGVSFEVPWTAVRGFWTGIMPFPPDLWRAGPEGPVVVLSLDPEATGGKDLVVHSAIDAWVGACRAMNIGRVRD